VNEVDLSDNPSDFVDGNKRDRKESKSYLMTLLGKYLSWALIFFAIASSSLSLYIAFRLSTEFQAEAFNLNKNLESRLAEDRKLIVSVKERIFSIDETLASRILTLEGRIEAGEDRLDDKINELDRGSPGIKEPPKHVQFLLTEALAALRWHRDKEHAVRVLENANKLMETEKLVKYEVLSDLISDEVLKLEIVKVDSFSSLFVELEELTDLIDGLAVSSKKSQEPEAKEEYDGYWDEFKGAFDQLVLIRSISLPADRFDLSNEIDVALLKLEWKLYVQEMRLAILNQDQYSYQDSVKRFENAVRKVKPRMANFGLFQAKIQAIGLRNVSPISSDIEEILARLQKAMESSV